MMYLVEPDTLLLAAFVVGTALWVAATIGATARLLCRKSGADGKKFSAVSIWDFK
jgi:hypothetical protein